MTYEDVVIAALARTLDWDGEFPSARQPMYRRVGKRQQQLFTMASKINPDFYGVDAVGGLDSDRSVNLRNLAGAPTVDQSVGVQRVEIFDKGTHATLVAGDEVFVVSVADKNAEVVPRMTLRDYILKAVSTDLDLVTSVCIFYPRYPDMPLAAEDGTTDLDISETHQELLVIDLTMDLVRKTLKMEPSTQAAIQGILKQEQDEALGPYLDDVRAFGIGNAHRFSEPAPTATR